MQRVAGALVYDLLPRRNVAFDLAPLARPTLPGTPVEIGKVGLLFIQQGNSPFHPPLISRFYDHVPTWKVLEQFSQGSSTVERHCDLLSVGTRKLEENMGSHGENG